MAADFSKTLGMMQSLIPPRNKAGPVPPLAEPAAPPAAATPGLFESMKLGRKGGLPIDMIVQVQRVYQSPEPQVSVQGAAPQGPGLKPGWGGRGR